MENGPNMLSAKKVKLHGMKSNRWQVKDKIVQYKGLIRLYKRDKDIVDVDTNIERRRQYRQLLQLQKSLGVDRENLQNAIFGDRQNIRNILCDHRGFQLAYQCYQPSKIIDCIEHVMFRKRKELDRLIYKLQMREQTLTDHKFEKATLEDRMHDERFLKLPVEHETEIIAGKVQDAFLKKEAALAIKQAYTQIVAIMKRDALYFDAVLNTLHIDGLAQTKCMIGATKLGQLATEYLDDRRQEYNTLEKLVLKDMQSRKVDLMVIQEQVDRAVENIKHLIRTDSDVNIGIIKIRETGSFVELMDELLLIEKTLKKLRETTKVMEYEDIFPCLKDQMFQNERLTEFMQKNAQFRDAILKKVNHAHLMRNNLRNSMVDTTMEYRRRKMQIAEEMKTFAEMTAQTRSTIRDRLQLVVNVRISVDQLQQLCKTLYDKSFQKGLELPRFKMAKTDAEEVKQPERDENDALRIIQLLVPKLTHFMGKLKIEDLEDNRLNDAYQFYETLMKDRTYIKHTKDITQENILEGLTAEVSHVLTREDIKRISDQIVQENSRNEDEVPTI